jgi:LDH2 family malate/lactate/ureidoglycolate dehydrogenase
MALYPTTAADRRVPAELLLDVVTKIYASCSMNAENAALLADTLVSADLRGVHSHGVLRVPDYAAKLTRDGVNPRGAPRIVRRTGGALLIDGDNAMGQIGGAFAMRSAIATARTSGIACAALGGSNHCGAMDWYARLAAAEDMIGLATTNAIPTMAPVGGAEKIVGMNPVAIAAPSASEHVLIVDTGFGATAHGKLRVYHQKGLPIPPGWALDADGRPTTDTAAALEGLIQPVGQYKGIGLAVLMGVLASLLSGAAYGLESGNMKDGAVIGVDGQFFIAIDIAAFADVPAFKRRVDGVIREIRACRRAEGAEEILAPGELEARLEREQRAKGVLLNAVTLNGILKTAQERGVDARALEP